MKSELETIIGLEVHIQLKTKSKMFCSCNNNSENIAPNTHVCPICMGFVGTLPLINKKAFYDSVLTGLALNCKIAKHTKWDRKNYFYPDLPKAYQISQYDVPLAYEGQIEVILENKKSKTIRINRLHLEEDAAKLTHTGDETLIDFNRAGTPLMEIVTEPDIRSLEEAASLLKELRRIVRYLNVSDADMEKGHLRCDASISLRPSGETKLYPRTEIKNLNSFKAVEKALSFEIEKQKNLWANGEANEEEITVLWDDEKQQTRFMRDKEGAADYRYFPEPDIPEVDLSEEEIANLAAKLPKLPAQRIKEYTEYGFDYPSALFITENKNLADYVDNILNVSPTTNSELHRLLAKWITSELFAIIKEISIYDLKLSPKDFFMIVESVRTKKITRIIGKQLLHTACFEEKNVLEEIEDNTISTSIDLDDVIETVLSENPKVVGEYKQGKEKVINVLVGLVMKKTNGVISPNEVVEKLKVKMK